jgi:hypothetical protein
MSFREKFENHLDALPSAVFDRTIVEVMPALGLDIAVLLEAEPVENQYAAAKTVSEVLLERFPSLLEMDWENISETPIMALYPMQLMVEQIGKSFGQIPSSTWVLIKALVEGSSRAEEDEKMLLDWINDEHQYHLAPRTILDPWYAEKLAREGKFIPTLESNDFARRLRAYREKDAPDIVILPQPPSPGL